MPAESSEVILALDQGTTGTTALVVDRDGAVRGRAYAEIRQHYPEPGFVYHDPEEIWTTSARVAGEALASAGPARLRALGVTNQRETTLVWDRRTGRALHPAIVWQSRQTAALCEALKAAGHEPLFRERTGLLLDAYFSGTKIRWILEHVPGLRSRAEAGELAFGTVDSWLLFRLSGGAVHATEPTNASRTLLYNIHERRWDEALLETLGVPAALLPEVRPSAGFFGECTGAGGLPPGVPITGMLGDQQAALYGQACWSPGMTKNTYGTGCFLMMNAGPSAPRAPAGLLTTLACDAQGRPSYALEGSIFVAGAAIQWLRDELRLITGAGETEGIARSVADTQGVYVVPAFAGLGAPYWDMGARGAILGLTRGAGRAQIVRATLESIAYQTRDVLEVMSTTGVGCDELRVDGGASANDFLMQFQADILGVPVERPAHVETTALGAALLAGVGCGFFKDPEQVGSARQRDRRFVPQMSVSRRERLYAGWREAVDRVRSRPS